MRQIHNKLSVAQAEFVKKDFALAVFHVTAKILRYHVHGSVLLPT